MSNIFYEDKIIANIIFKGQVLEDGYRFIEISYCERELDEDGNPVKNENGDDMAKVERYIKNEEGKEVPEVLLLTEIRPYREDCTHPEIRHLVDEKGWTEERIQTQTNLEIRRASEEWQLHNKEFLDGAKEQIREEYKEALKEIERQSNFDNVIDYVLNNNSDEELFRCKLSALSLDKVKKSKAKTLKNNIRNAKTMIEVFGIIAKLK
tara:strand:- start:1101 stop:1724 length:624 start_codon:yes stop_codon:yes gene_type:complete